MSPRAGQSLNFDFLSCSTRTADFVEHGHCGLQLKRNEKHFFLVRMWPPPTHTWISECGSIPWWLRISIHDGRTSVVRPFKEMLAQRMGKLKKFQTMLWQATRLEVKSACSVVCLEDLQVSTSLECR